MVFRITQVTGDMSDVREFPTQSQAEGYARRATTKVYLLRQCNYHDSQSGDCEIKAVYFHGVKYVREYDTISQESNVQA